MTYDQSGKIESILSYDLADIFQPDTYSSSPKSPKRLHYYYGADKIEKIIQDEKRWKNVTKDFPKNWRLTPEIFDDLVFLVCCFSS